jgi:hypothetical protein
MNAYGETRVRVAYKAALERVDIGTGFKSVREFASAMIAPEGVKASPAQKPVLPFLFSPFRNASS